MVTPEKKAQKAFGLYDYRDMLKKLNWELKNLFLRQRSDISACAYHSFNCAVTAWHVTDWLWHDLSSLSKIEIKAKEKRIKFWKTCQEFQRYVRDNCPALRLCHQIATGSKHCLMTYNPDPSIAAAISNGEKYDFGNPIIIENGSHHSADQVFYDALVWLEKFHQDWGIFPEEPFCPIDDEPKRSLVKSMTPSRKK